MHISDDKITILESVDSTNTYAMDWIKSGSAAHGEGVFAIEQTSGKGRGGKKWITEPGANVQISIITQTAGLPLADRFCLSMAAALCVREIVQGFCKDDVFVKWPNDVIVGNRKIAGILIENIIRGHSWEWSVTGIGLNVNQKTFPEGRGTSLLKETSVEQDVPEITRKLRHMFVGWVDRWKETGMTDWIEDYNSHLFKKGQPVKLKKDNRVFESVIQGVTREGKLITRDFMQHEWDLDEVVIQY
ncbi:MAG: biotin--[acetyl-CoA-carboxylase] ligase [Chitinophagaceae bacterium]|nr:biotin--[acetyl-CoA-carboxylase] ligase [Chitinophagaceae bacterium]